MVVSSYYQNKENQALSTVVIVVVTCSHSVSLLFASHDTLSLLVASLPFSHPRDEKARRPSLVEKTKETTTPPYIFARA